MITVFPYGIDIIDWADNLVLDYWKETLPILKSPDEWPEWGTIVVGLGTFAERGCPAPIKIVDAHKDEPYGKWEDWAKQIYATMIVYNRDSK